MRVPPPPPPVRKHTGANRTMAVFPNKDECFWPEYRQKESHDDSRRYNIIYMYSESAVNFKRARAHETSREMY